MKMPVIGVLFLFFCCFTCLDFTAAQSIDAVNKKQVIAKARNVYYNLRNLGLSEFQASIQPNWELTLQKAVESNPEAAQTGLKLLHGIHFSMTLDPQGRVKVEHSTDAPPPNKKADADFQQIYSGIDEVVSGFFTTWSLFMVTSPLPAVDSTYQLENIGGQYRLSYKDGGADVITTLNKDLIITEILVDSPQFRSTIVPQFAKSPKGLILSSYVSDYRPASSTGTAHLSIRIDYQEATGFQLPRVLDVDVTYDTALTRTQLTFSNYSVKTKP